MSEEKKERETKEITTPIGHELRLKTYITGREERDIKNVYLDKVNIKQTPQGQYGEGLKGSSTTVAEDLAIKTVIVSMDGDKGNIVSRILDLPSSEKHFIVKEINKVTNPELDEDKKKV